MANFAVPTLPMRKSSETRKFYEALGFICAHEQAPPDSFLYMMKDGIHLQFFESPYIDGSLRDHTCYIYVEDLQATFESFQKAGVGKLLPIELKPWGVPEFCLVDVNDNLLRVGCPRIEM